MGQYFKLVNPERKEFVDLPGGMKAIERVTNPIAMGMVGYLLLEGPCDGTAFTYRFGDESDPLVNEAINAWIEREIEYEKKQDYTSMCRDDNGEWKMDDVRRIAVAGLNITHVCDYAGRWAGDDVRLVGDYADNDLYSDTNESWTYEYEGEQFTTYATSSAPIVPTSIERDDIMHSTENRDVETGDLCHVRHPDTDERVYAHFVEVAESVWTNITEGLKQEFAQFVGEEWLENNGGAGILRPDAVITA